MEGITVHKLNEKLVVSLYELPGFKRMGGCVIRGEDGTRTGNVNVYYAGSFFQSKLQPGDRDRAIKAAMRLAQNFAVKQGIGRYATRLNLTSELRKDPHRIPTIKKEKSGVQDKSTETTTCPT